MASSPRPQPTVPMPAVLNRPVTWILGLTVLLVPFFIRIPLVLRRHPVVAPLGDQLHVVLLAGVAFILYWRGPFTGRLRAAAVATAVIGGAIEFLQLLVGRSALLHDFLLDLVGIGLVVGFVLWRGHGRRAGMALMVAMGLCILSQLYAVPGTVLATRRARELFPVLADFERGRDTWIWGTQNNCRIEFVTVDDSPTGPGRVLRVTGAPPNDWPGATFHRFPHNWADKQALLFDVRLAAAPGDTARIALRLDDYPGVKKRQWVSRHYEATHTWRTCRFPLVGLRIRDDGREVDLSDVERLYFYLPRPDMSTSIEIDNIRLE